MDRIVPILALIGSICGVLLVYVVSNRNRPSLMITVGKEVKPWVMLGGEWHVQMYILFINTGEVPVGIQKVGLEFGNRIKHFSVPIDIPSPSIEIKKGQTHKVAVTVDAIDKHRLLWAWAKDTTGKQYRSKIHPYIKAD